MLSIQIPTVLQFGQVYFYLNQIFFRSAKRCFQYDFFIRRSHSQRTRLRNNATNAHATSPQHRRITNRDSPAARNARQITFRYTISVETYGTWHAWHAATWHVDSCRIRNAEQHIRSTRSRLADVECLHVAANFNTPKAPNGSAGLNSGYASPNAF